MKNQAVIELAADAPEQTAAILEGLPYMSVHRDQPASLLRVGDYSVPLFIVHGGLRPYAHVTAGLLGSMAGEAQLGMVVADRLAPHVRRELENAGSAYADAAGAVHIDVPGLLLHIEPGQRRGSAKIQAPAGIGVVGVRLVQVMLGDPQRDWSVAELAEAADSSAGQAHKILTRLESEGLVTVTGRGPARRRRITSPGDLLDWLAAVPSARRVRERLHAFMYAPDVMKLATRISMRAMQSGLVYAITGAGGAALLGARAAVSAIPEMMIRIDPDVGLHHAAELLQAEPVDSGANLMLVRDLGRLGVHHSASNGPVIIAPPPRVWLDMLGEPRGEDAAALFREAFFGW